jgi:hypothetical protein
VLRIWIRCLFDPLDPVSGMSKKKDHVSESLETIFWVKILKFFDANPGWKNFEPEIQDKHPECTV